MASSPHDRPRYGWRLVRAHEWAATLATGTLELGGIDARDGYVHMSPASAVRDTAALYFAGVASLWLLQIGEKSASSRRRWPLAAWAATHTHTRDSPWPPATHPTTAHCLAARPLPGLPLPPRADLPLLGADIRWDHVASRGVDFPHLYNRPLPRDAVTGAWPVPWDGAAFGGWPAELE
jgi:uncharacterized protein (DUF952 family)